MRSALNHPLRRSRSSLDSPTCIDSSAGGDSPQYVQDMRGFFAANASHLAYESTFQGTTVGGSYGIGTPVPDAAAAYRAGF